MQALLTRIGIARDAVASLAAPHGRERLLSEALRPAAMTDLWRQKAAEPAFEAHVATALETLTVIEAANAEEESLAIAVALREAVHDGKTAALVTPDRALGRRVLAALARWNIAAEDSGGDALAETPAGIFARLAAETALHGFAPVTLLALLKHPLLRLDMGGTEDAVATLERAILRGPARPGTAARPRAGTPLGHALKTLRETKDSLHPSDPRRALTDAELAAAADLVARLGDALKPFESLGRTKLPLSELAARHRDVLAALSRQGKDEVAFAGRDGTKLSDALDELAASRGRGPLVRRAARLSRIVFRGPCRPRRASRRAAGHARAHPRTARGAADRKRPRRARRPGRRHLAAGEPNRRLAQPPDAAQARPRSAGAPHRPFRP